MWGAFRKRLTEGSIVDRRYVLERRISRTRGAEVFHGRQLSTMQEVVVKLPLAHASGRDRSAPARRQLLREMAACARMHHPNVVRMLDGGDLGRNGVYVVMEHVEGQTLRAVLDAEGWLEPFEARRLMLQVLDGIACCHGAGIVHQDVRPENILVTARGPQRNALVANFGLAAPAASNAPTTPAWWTRADWPTEDTQYLAPEQLTGQITPQCDLFAWGLVYLECLTGKPALARLSPRESIRLLPVPIPEALLAHPLGHILARATALDLSERYANPAVLLADLSRCPMRGLNLGGPVHVYSAEPTSVGAWSEPLSVPPTWPPSNDGDADSTARLTAGSAPAATSRHERPGPAPARITEPGLPASLRDALEFEAGAELGLEERPRA